MATKKISALSTGTTANSSDKIPIERSGVNYYITPAMITSGLSGGYTEGCRLYNSGNISVADNTIPFVLLTFDTELYDTDTMHSTVTNPGRITFTTAGKYLVIFNGVFSTDAAGRRIAYLYLNGTTTALDQWTSVPGSATISPSIKLAVIEDFQANDYVQVGVYQDSGSPLVVNYIDRRSPFFMAQRIG